MIEPANSLLGRLAGINCAEARKKKSLSPREIPLFRGLKASNEIQRFSRSIGRSAAWFGRAERDDLEEVAERAPLDIGADQQAAGEFHAIATFAQQ